MTKIDYIPRTRDYYRAQGFTADYQWAENTEIPFTALTKPLTDCTLALVTTAVAQPEIPKPIRTAKSYPLEQVPRTFYTDELSWDKDTTHTNDRQSYFPIEHLEAFVRAGTVGRLAPRFHFVPTEFSQRHTLESDAPATVDACQQDGVDVALLVPL